MTYGISANCPVEKGDPKHLIEYFPDLKGFRCQRFSTFVVKGQDVECDHVVSHVFHPVTKDATRAKIIVVYTDESVAPRYPNEKGVKTLGSFILDMPNTTGGLDREIEVDFKFGDVEFYVLAKDPLSGTAQRKPFNFQVY